MKNIILSALFLSISFNAFCQKDIVSISGVTPNPTNPTVIKPGAELQWSNYRGLNPATYDSQYQPISDGNDNWWLIKFGNTYGVNINETKPPGIVSLSEWNSIFAKFNIQLPSKIGETIILTDADKIVINKIFKGIRSNVDNTDVIFTYNGAISLKFNANGNLSDEEFIKNSVIVYPNPAKGQVSICNLEPNSTISFYTLFGQKVYSENTNATSISISLENLTESIYMLQISSENNVKNVKLIIQK